MFKRGKSQHTLSSCTRYYVRVKIKGDNGEEGVSSTSFFETGKNQQPWQASFLTTKKEDSFHPVFMKTISLVKKVKQARLYCTGLGLYEVYINKKKVGVEYLAPLCSDYNKKIQYQTYDVTYLVQEVQDIHIEILTGNGWYKGRLGYEGGIALYGNEFAVIAEIQLIYEDDSKEVVGTDTSWKYKRSAIIESDLYDGEVIDQNIDEYDENKELTNQLIPVRLSGLDHSLLVERYSLPVVVKEERKVEKVIHTPKGELILDFGQNFTGFVEFKNTLPKGSKITLDFGEILQEGNFYRDNYRTAKSRFSFISAGKEEWIRPHFTFFGFRYVRICTDVDFIDEHKFIGKVIYTDIDTTISFSSSHWKLNRLHQNSLWGQKSNFLDLPTDCPQRDERLGWTGDAQVFSPTACLHMDTRAFYRKFLRDLALDQKDHDGEIANYIPNIGHMPGGSSVWGDVATFLPMTLYSCYGNKEELSVYYPMMKDWVDYIIRKDKENNETGLWNFGFHFGDWLAQDGITPESMKGGTEDYFIASAYYYASTKKLAEAAEILEKEEDASFYQSKAEKVYEAILEEYFSPTGRLAIDSQTGYLISLKFNIYRNIEKVKEGLLARMKKDCYKIKGGFVGATMMCQVLGDNGMEEIANHVLFQNAFPGWFHCIDLGATTIWERWNSVLDDGSMSKTSMNSLNHYAYGAVMEYVYHHLAGIREASPGYTKVTIKPKLTGKLSYVNYQYHSVSGTYVSNWKIHQDGQITVLVKVPFGCSATLTLPGEESEIYLNGGEFETTYRPKKDFRLLYDINSRLEEFKEDERALLILKEELPIAYKMIKEEDVESTNLSLKELRTMFFLGFNPAIVDKAAALLLELKGEFDE